MTSTRDASTTSEEKGIANTVSLLKVHIIKLYIAPMLSIVCFGEQIIDVYGTELHLTSFPGSHFFFPAGNEVGLFCKAANLFALQ